MNRQEVFDKVATHLFNQGQRAYGKDGCMYRGPNKTKCAVGCLIPDEKYFESIENRTVDGLLEDFPEFFEILDVENGDDKDFLSCLQTTHDQSCYWLNTKTMFERLHKVADTYGVNSAILDSLNFSADRPDPRDFGPVPTPTTP